ncbi:hypothetical protein [Microbispora bryophytorum]|uniref:hypothetical protein n=1 Tax=Microbispora bryophytorum TaxID=1460882 RepID=UPI0033EE9B8A
MTTPIPSCPCGGDTCTCDPPRGEPVVVGDTLVGHQEVFAAAPEHDHQEPTVTATRKRNRNQRPTSTRPASTPSDVITKILRRPTPTAEDILGALDKAGFRLIRPEGEIPAWMPTTQRALAKVKQFADLRNKGKAHAAIAVEMKLSPRQVERYGAAAAHLGLTQRRR